MTANKTSDALEILGLELYEGNPERIAESEEARVNDNVGRKIRELRFDYQSRVEIIYTLLFNII